MRAADSYFIAPDANDELWIWRRSGRFPVPVLARFKLLDDPVLWDAIVTAIEGES